MLTLLFLAAFCGAALGADSTTAPPAAVTTKAAPAAPVATTAAPTAAPSITGVPSTTTGAHAPPSTTAAAPGSTAGMVALAAAAAAAAAAPAPAAAAAAAPAAAAATAAPAPAGAPPASSLVTLYSYKNNQYSTHAYCSTDDCTATVRSRGFKAEKSARGKVIAPTDAALAAAKAACPGVTFHPLGFPKKRQGYVHDLTGRGLQAGYVVTSAGQCKATVGLKQYNAMFSDDIWYTPGQSKQNVQNGGKPVFYLWE